MKKLITLALAAAVLMPAAAMAQEGQRPMLRGEVKAEAHGSTSPAGLPKLGPAIRGIASSTRALGASTTEMVKARVAAIKDLISKKREDSKMRADEARSKAKERFGENIERLVGNVSARLASTSAHLSSIADRIDNRIDTLEDEGHDMDASIALLATARTDLSLADDKILAVNMALDAAMATTTPKAQMPQVRAAVKAAEDALRLVKEDLMKTIRSVKIEASATTTSN